MILRRILPSIALSLVLIVAVAFASSTSTLNLNINSGTLLVDIADSTNSYTTVASPSVTFSAASFSFACQSTTATFGTATQTIYVVNPDAADNGWTVTLAASSPTVVWDSAGSAAEFDFNDPTTAGCTDGGDTDTVGGQMTVDPSVATLAVGDCTSCVTTNVSLGSSSAFSEGVTNSITLLTGSSASNDVGDWEVTGIDLSQTLPAEQAAHADYSLSLTLSITAS
jgi:hypothetical protein